MGRGKQSRAPAAAAAGAPDPALPEGGRAFGACALCPVRGVVGHRRAALGGEKIRVPKKKKKQHTHPKSIYKNKTMDPALLGAQVS